MKERIREFIKNLTFRKVVIGLTAFVIFMFLLSGVLPNSVRDSLLPVETPETVDNLTYTYSESLPSGAPIPTPLNAENKSYPVLDAMPYISERFNVNYVDGTQTFHVLLDPAYGATEEDVYNWFATFPDVADPHSLLVVFDDPYGSGAPAR